MQRLNIYVIIGTYHKLRKELTTLAQAKRDNNRRARNKSLGIKLSQEELDRLNEVCKKDNITKVELLMQAVTEREEK